MSEAQYVDRDGCTYRIKDNVKISNFTVKVLAVKKCTCQSNTEYKYDIEFTSGNNTYRREISKQELPKYDYSDIHPTLLLFPIPNANKEMAYAIMEQVQPSIIEEIYVANQLGWHTYNGIHFYCAGDSILSNTSTSKINIDINIPNLHFEYDSTISEKDALKAAFDTIKIAPQITFLLFAENLLGIIRQLLSNAGIQDTVCVSIVGRTHSQKTTGTKLIISLYNRSNLDSGLQSTRMCSSLPIVEKMLTDMKDTSILLDDLNTSNQSSERKKQEALLHYALREAGDNCGRATLKTTAQVNAKVFITAEYVPDFSISDIGRTIILNVDRPMANDLLTKCQRHPLALSTFYKYFIEWISSKYDEIVYDIKCRYEKHRQTSCNSSNRYKRLDDQKFLLEYVFDLFLSYAKKLIDFDYEGFTQLFKEYLNNTIESQLALIDKMQLRDRSRNNLSSAVLAMWKCGYLTDLGKNSKCFKKSNCLYITALHLSERLHSFIGVKLSTKNIVSYFRSHDFSGFYDDGTSKKIGNLRYLTLNFAELNMDASKEH